LHSFGLNNQKNTKKCFSKASTGASEVQVNKNEVLIQTPTQIRVIPFSNQKEIKYNITSGKAIYLKNCGIIVASGNQGNNVLSVNTNKGSFDQITTVDGPFESTTFSCNVESDGKHLVTTQVSGSSTVKV